jgi:hypothetical protein
VDEDESHREEDGRLLLLLIVQRRKAARSDGCRNMVVQQACLRRPFVFVLPSLFCDFWVMSSYEFINRCVRRAEGKTRKRRVTF